MDFGYELQSTTQDNLLVIEVSGELTSLKSRYFLEDAQDRVGGEEFKGLLIDLSRLNYLDSAGLGTCVRLFANSQGKGASNALQIKSDGTMDSLIAFANMARVVPIFKSRPEALRFLASGMIRPRAGGRAVAAG